jgi:hypothetical protein
MEQRRSSRKLLRQPVDIEAPRIGLLSAVSRDLSLGGMFVETESGPLPPNATVSVSFNLPHNGSPGVFRLDAAVVRSAPNGMGLMFLQMPQDVIRALSDALAARTNPARLPAV